MRLLDRYILSIFLRATGVFLLVLLGLFITVDFVSRLDKFLGIHDHNIVLFIGRYYLVRIPMFLVLILPTLALFASMFTMVRLNHRHELTPIVTSGVSLRRVAVPFIGAAVVWGAAVAFLDEVVLPGVSEELVETEQAVQNESLSYGVCARNAEGVVVYAALMENIRRVLKEVTVDVLGPRGERNLRVAAEEARWDRERGKWVLFRGKVTRYRNDGAAGSRIEAAPLPEAGWALEADLPPEMLLKNKLGRFLSLAQARRILRSHGDVPALRMQIHSRWVLPLASVILLLLGFPYCGHPEEHGIFRGVIVCLIIILAYYLTYFTLLDFGNRGEMSPVVASWLTPGLFGAAGGVLFARMRT